MLWEALHLDVPHLDVLYLDNPHVAVHFLILSRTSLRTSLLTKNSLGFPHPAVISSSDGDMMRDLCEEAIDALDDANHVLLRRLQSARISS